MADYRGLLNYNGIDDPQNVVPSALGLLDGDKGKLLAMLRAAEANPQFARGPRPTPQPSPSSINTYGPEDRITTQDEPNVWSKLLSGGRRVADEAGLLFSPSEDSILAPARQRLGEAFDDVASITNRLGLLENDPITGQPKNAPETAAAPTEEEAPEAPKITPETTLGELHEVQVTAQKKKAQEQSQALHQKARQDLAQQGATEEQLSGWDKFASEFDLMTVGMALLASNDGSGSVVTNLGQALMLGRQAAIDMEDRDFDQTLALNELMEKQIENDSKQNKRTQDIRVADNNTGIAQQNADSRAAALGPAQLAANASMLRAQQALIKGQKISDVDKKAVIDGTSAYLKSQGVREDTAEGLKLQMANEVNELVQKSGGTVGYGEAMRLLMEDYQIDGTLEPTGFFQSGDWKTGKVVAP
jgi:hypothetical protein